MPAAWDRRSASEQARAEELLLAEWLPGAVAFAPHWTARAERIEADPRTLVTRADLDRFAPSLQGDVATRGGAALVQRPTESQVKAMASGSLLGRIARGISGDQLDGKRRVLLEEFKPVHVTRGGAAAELAIASSRSDLDRAHRAGARAAAVLGLGDHDYLVSAVPAGPSAAFWGVRSVALGASMLALHPRGHGDTLAQCVDAFDLVPATSVACLPEEAVAWADVLADADADVSRVVHVVLVGPPPTDEQREAVVEAWRRAGALGHELVVRTLWAPDVHRGLWAECADGIEGLHTTPDMEVLETLESLSGGVTDRGGDLTITTLGWRGTTLLRYRTGVRVASLRADGEPCPACGRTVPRIVGAVQPAAWQPSLRRKDGEVTLDLRALAVELEASAAAVWRVSLQRRRGVDGYVVELGGDIERSQVERLRGRLDRSTGVPVTSIMVSREVEPVANRIRVLGSPFVDNR